MFYNKDVKLVASKHNHFIPDFMLAYTSIYPKSIHVLQQGCQTCGPANITTLYQILCWHIPASTRKVSMFYNKGVKLVASKHNHFIPDFMLAYTSIYPRSLHVLQQGCQT
ncbi:hypothetical protein AVEN_190099-1, partial [Araneus ventricosus]